MGVPGSTKDSKVVSRNSRRGKKETKKGREKILIGAMVDAIHDEKGLSPHGLRQRSWSEKTCVQKKRKKDRGP